LAILRADIVVAFPHPEGMIKQTLTHSPSLPAPPKRTNLGDEPKNGANWHAFHTSQGNQHPKPAVPTINGKETSDVLHFPSLMVGPQRSTGGVIANSGGKTDSPIASQ
jgi:hypothetical protein